MMIKIIMNKKMKKDGRRKTESKGLIQGYKTIYEWFVKISEPIRIIQDIKQFIIDLLNYAQIMFPFPVTGEFLNFVLLLVLCRLFL